MLRQPVSATDHTRGSHAPRVVVVEYGDYQCPYCALAHPVVLEILRRLNDVAVVYRHFPLTEVHPLAEPAAQAAELAGSRGLFWEMHDGVFANQPKLSGPLILALGSQLGLDATDLREAVAKRKYAAKVEGDFLGGVRSGVNGTPTFFINGRRHDGAFGLESMLQAIRGA